MPNVILALVYCRQHGLYLVVLKTNYLSTCVLLASKITVNIKHFGKEFSSKIKTMMTQMSSQSENEHMSHGQEETEESFQISGKYRRC